MKCIYCHQPSSLFSKRHRACELSFKNGRVQIMEGVKQRLRMNSSFSTADIKLISSNSFIDNYKPIVVDAVKESLAAILSDNILSDEEYERLTGCINEFSLTNLNLGNDTVLKVIKANILRQVMKGEVPDGKYLDIVGNLPFVIQPDENLIWYKHASYFERNSSDVRNANAQGGSVSVWNGLYFPTGAFQNVLMQKKMTLISPAGILGITQKNIYFASLEKHLKLAINRLTGFKMYSNGFGFQEDRADPHPQAFGNVDGWFIYNLVTNLHNLF